MLLTARNIQKETDTGNLQAINIMREINSLFQKILYVMNQYHFEKTTPSQHKNQQIN